MENNSGFFFETTTARDKIVECLVLVSAVSGFRLQTKFIPNAILKFNIPYSSLALRNGKMKM